MSCVQNKIVSKAYGTGSCSLGCFKKHKNDSCRPVREATPPAPCPDSSRSRGESKELMTQLQNPHLRNLMLSVDSAKDKSKAMKQAMQEPLFVELANQCLQIIKPTE
ncbi:hypothetical protein QTP86_000731 [Hemibagrus guttatus]|nr:hypothetical protein QTP86_000731 [Hemibagrus guttatus]